MRLYHALERLESTVESMASLAGAVLQIPKQALALKYKAKLPFMDSRLVGSLGIEQVIWEGRNHAVHWEDNQPHTPIKKMLETLGRENGLEIAIGKNNSPTIIYALGWKTADDVINYLAKLIGFGELAGGSEVQKPPIFLIYGFYAMEWRSGRDRQKSITY